MRNYNVTLFLASCFVLMAGLLAACASAPPTPEVDYKRDFDFSGIRTIAFLQQSARTSGDSPRMFLSDIQLERIDNAITNAVELKGYQMVEDPSQADALISWHLVVQEKTDVRTYNTGPSYGGYYGRGPYRSYNRSAFYNCWNCGTEVRVRQYTQGTFIVDIIDPGLKQSVWRAVTHSRLKGEVEQDQQPYNEAAQRIMAGFPPY